MAAEKSDLFTKIGMGSFLICVLLFVSMSSYLYFNNSSTVEIRIKTDNELKREKDAVNEALTQELTLKNDTLSLYKTESYKRDSLLATKMKFYENKIVRMQFENDSLYNILRNLQRSDIQPVNRKIH